MTQLQMLRQQWNLQHQESGGANPSSFSGALLKSSSLTYPEVLHNMGVHNASDNMSWMEYNSLVGGGIKDDSVIGGASYLSRDMSHFLRPDGLHMSSSRDRSQSVASMSIAGGESLPSMPGSIMSDLLSENMVALDLAEPKQLTTAQRTGTCFVEQESPVSKLIAANVNRRNGLMYLEQADLEGAQQHFHCARDIHELRQVQDSLSVAYRYNHIGWMLQDQGDLEGALEHYQLSLKIRQLEAPDSPDVAASHCHIGSVLRARGDLEGALEKYRLSLKIEERNMPNSLSVATSYNNIGGVLQALGREEEAKPYFNRAKEIQER